MKEAIFYLLRQFLLKDKNLSEEQKRILNQKDTIVELQRELRKANEDTDYWCSVAFERENKFRKLTGI